MALIDDEGNLFGVVNVIDALAVLLVLAVAVAGIAVVGVLSGGGEPETRYATVDLGSQPDYVVDSVEAGDEMAVEGYDQNLTVTDVYATSDGESSHLTVRTALEGELVENDGEQVFEFAGERLRAGNGLEIETTDYTAAGNVTSLDQNGSDLNVETTPVLLESTVSTTTANEITEGDTFEAGPHTIATVTNVRSYPTDDNQRRVHIGAELETLRQGGSLTFSNQPLTLGSQISLSGDAYSVSGELVRRGATELQGEAQSRYVTLDLGSQPDYIVDRVTEGDTMNVSDEQLTVTDVYASPAGNGAGHLTVRAEVDGRLVETLDRDEPVYQFAGERLRIGNDLEIDIDDYVTSGQVTSLDRNKTKLNVETTPVLLESTVSTTTANEITEGDTFEAGSRTVATVTNVQSYPTNDDRRRVHVGVELEALQESGSLIFSNQPLTVGSQVSLSSGSYSISGELMRRGATELESEPDSRYVTLDLGSQPEYIVDRVAEGDTMNVSDEQLTVTDVHASPAEDGNGYLTIRAEVDGRLVETLDRDEPVYQFAGERLRIGDGLEIDVDDYVTSGQVTSLDRNGTNLNVETTPVLLESTISTTTADEISEGDTFDIGPHTVGTVATVESYPVSGDQRRVHVGIELETITRGSTPHFAGQRVAVDNQLSLTSSTYSLSGEIIRRGATEAAGETGETKFELKLENVDPDIANGLETGMAETERNKTLATVQSVDTQPAEVILESEDGNIYLREHPTNKDIRLTIEGQTMTAPSGVRFHGESLREGDSVTLDLGSMIVTGEVTELNPDE